MPTKPAIWSDGKACPLCGSEHHPNVAHQADISDSIQQKNEQKKAFQEQNEQLERDMQLSERLKYHARPKATQV